MVSPTRYLVFNIQRVINCRHNVMNEAFMFSEILVCIVVSISVLLKLCYKRFHYIALT